MGRHVSRGLAAFAQVGELGTGVGEARGGLFSGGGRTTPLPRLADVDGGSSGAAAAAGADSDAADEDEFDLDDVLAEEVAAPVTRGMEEL